MKKIAVSLILALSAITIVGCSSNSTSEQYNLLSVDEPITVTLWHYYAGSALETLTKITDDFNQGIGAENGVKVQIVSKPSISDLEIELSESAQGVVYADEMPSMFLAYADKILELQEQGVISDMNQFFTEEDKDFLIEDFLHSGIINEEQVMMPVVKSTELMYLNDTTWNEFSNVYGYTYEDISTWDGILEVSKTYYDYTDELTPNIDNDGKAFFGMDSINNFIIVSSMQKNVDMFDAVNGKANIDEDVVREIFDFYMESWGMGYMDSIAKYRTDDIRSGNLMSFIGSSAGFVYMPEWMEVNGTKQDIQWKAIQYPYYNGGEHKVVSQGAGIAVSKISDQQQQACALFLNYFWEDNISFAIESAYVPVTNEFLNMSVDERNEKFDEQEFDEEIIRAYDLVSEQIENGMLYQSNPFYGSYIIRTEIGYSFEKTATNIRQIVLDKTKNGMSRQEAFNDIDLEKYYDEMMELFYKTLDSKGVKY